MSIFNKLKETSISVLPIMAIVLIMGLTIVPLDKVLLARFFISGLLLIIGLTVFLLGVDMGIQPMGERCGAELTKKRNLPLLLVCAFIIGFIVTAAEPDIQVFSNQVKNIYNFVSKNAITFVIAGGVGLFIMIGIIRSVLNNSIKLTLALSYLVLLTAAFFTPSPFIGVAFDSGGATTGPMTVPFIMALGLGVSQVRAGSENSFGLTGVTSVGPVLAVLAYAIFLKTSGQFYPAEVTIADVARLTEISSVSQGFLAAVFSVYKETFIHALIESLTSILPLLGLFAVFQITLLKMSKRQTIRLLIGFAYSLAGLTIFLTGVNSGFMQTGQAIGIELGLKAASSVKWLIFLLFTGCVLGAIIVCAEPAVWVLSEQVEQISGGTIKRKFLLIFLSAGTAVAVCMSLWLGVTGFELKWILLAGYIIAFILMIFSPDLFSGIAFDSGGVASGPLTSTFILSFTIGASSASSGSADSFGVIALVAMMPLIMIQLMGIIFRKKEKKHV